MNFVKEDITWWGISFMEDYDSGQSHFLPHIFFPRHVPFSQWPQDNAVDPQSSTKNSYNAMLSHYKTYRHVEKWSFSIRPLHCLYRIRMASDSTYLMESFAVNEYAERLAAASVGLLADPLLEPQMFGGITVCQDICDTARLKVECVCTWEALWSTCHKRQITAAGYDIYVYILYIMVWGLKSLYVYVNVFMDACWIVSFSSSYHAAKWKVPIKSIANCAIIHSPDPAGYQIPSRVIDQNKTKTQTNTHTHSIVLLTHSVASVCVCSLGNVTAQQIRAGNPHSRPGSKLRGHSERQRPDSHCRTLTRFNHSSGNIKRHL